MDYKKTTKLMKILLYISGAFILVGAMFQLQHWAYGIEIFWIGILSNLVLSSYEINRLRKKISELER